MELFAAIYYDSDDCTYWADIVLGVFDERGKADAACLLDNEAYPHSRPLENYRVDTFKLNELWS